MAGRRYNHLDRSYWFEAFNKIRHAFLAAKDGNEVDKVTNAILTLDERIKVGRRIQIVKQLLKGSTFDEIVKDLKVAKETVSTVAKTLEENKEGFELIFKREERVEKEFKKNAYIKVGPSKLFHKRTEYTGFRRRDVER